MRAVWLWLALAGGLWLAVFSPWTRDIVPFWPGMAVSTALLAAAAIHSQWMRVRSLFWFEWSYLWIGLLSAAALYAVFWVGHEVSIRILPFASEQVGRVYDSRDNLPLGMIAMLLFFWIGPAEEIFWRGFVQDRFAGRYGTFWGYALAAALYAGVHVWSFNLMLLAAAGICGAFWGLLFARYKSLWPGLISHAVWDVLIFVLFPIR